MKNTKGPIIQAFFPFSLAILPLTFEALFLARNGYTQQLFFMKRIFFLFVLAALTLSANAQTPKQDRIANKLFKEKSELYFKFKIENRSEIATFTKLVSIDNVKGNTVFAYANKSQFLNFLEANKHYQVLTNPSQLQQVEMMMEIGRAHV